MRLLFLTNIFPPASDGGYEEWCAEVAEGLRERGHEVLVLTTNSIVHPVTDDPSWVRRDLLLEMEYDSWANAFRFFTVRKEREQENIERFLETVNRFRPEAVMVWGMWNVPRSLPALAENMYPARLVYYIGDYWASLPNQYENYWKAPARSILSAVPKALLRPLAMKALERETRHKLRLERVLFPSRFMLEEHRRKGVSFGRAQVIYGGVDTTAFDETRSEESVPKPATDGDRLRLLYTGRLSPEKGIETAIEAVEELVCRRGLRNLHLNIVGSGERRYVEQLHSLVQEKGLAGHIKFTGRVRKEDMPGVYQAHDIFLFTSIWEEPFGRVLVEALASGLVVIGTATGGAAEIQKEAGGGLTFPPGYASALADNISRLYLHPSQLRELVRDGRRAAIEKFDISRMVGEVEAYLLDLVQEV